jgi:PTS system mannose-specific IIA component
MLGMLVVTHGRLAEDLVEAVQTIVGPVEGLAAVSIGWNDEVDDATRMIEEAIGRVDSGQGVLVLTDMFGGTPTNLGLALHERGKIEIVTGVNLPMLVKFANLREEMPIQEAAAKIAEQGREAIHVASHVLDASHRGPDRDAP